MRSVLFDVDGVLVHGYTGQVERRRRWDEHLLADLGIDPSAFRHLFIKQVFEKEVLTGRKALISALEEILPQLGFHGSPFIVASYWLNRDSHLNLQLLDVIRHLRRTGRARLYVATNQEHMRAFHLWNRHGFENLFDDMLHAARLGELKPGRAFFEGAARILGPQDEPPLFFDDSEAVVVAANEVGWEGVLFNKLEDCTAHPWISAMLYRES
ncbi:HAD family hydrolase [Neorhizobium sp. T25_27]|uniref:HAD family hydrolase n=1 Tax=Neorhizobium sp. T25_27 TaxID=2093831 RepID=UPI000CF9ED13|nr:HAD family hydrolase [Neorhizobium sp. T25_27]